MRNARSLVVLTLVVLMLPAASVFAGLPVPEIDPSSLSAGVALAMTSAALIIERRRRR